MLSSLIGKVIDKNTVAALKERTVEAEQRLKALLERGGSLSFSKDWEQIEPETRFWQWDDILNFVQNGFAVDYIEVCAVDEEQRSWVVYFARFVSKAEQAIVELNPIIIQIDL